MDTITGMKLDFAPVACFAVQKGFNRKVRKGRKEKTTNLTPCRVYTGNERVGNVVEHVVFLFDRVVDVGQAFFGMSGSSCESVGRC